MKIAIIGPGAIGLSLAFFLSKHFSDMDIVCRSKNRKNILLNGVDIKFRGNIYRMKVNALSVDELTNDKYDVIFIAVKAYDFDQALDIAKKISHDKTIVVSLQNGLRSYELAYSLFLEKAICGIVLFGAYREGYNYVVIASDKPKIILGSKHGITENVYRVSSILSISGINVEVVKDIDSWRWLKLAVNAVINPLTALFEVKNGAIHDNPLLKELSEKLLEEIVKVINTLNIELALDPRKHLIEVISTTSNNISSMLQDILNCRKTEIDYINGVIVEIGKFLGIDVHLNELIYKLIKIKESLACSPYKVLKSLQ